LIKTVFSVESSVDPHEGIGDLTLHYWETNGTDILRVYRLPCEISDEGIQCDTMKESNKILEKEINSDGYEQLSISGYGIYRICVKLKESGRQDCDKDNYYLLQDQSVQTVVQYVEVEKIVEKKDIEVNVISVPTKVDQNISFSVKVNVSNPFEPVEAEIYSYVYNGSRCVSGGWTKNKKTVRLETNYTEVSLNNTAIFPGTFKFKVRVKHNNTDYDSHPIEISVEEIKFSRLSMSKIRYSNNTIRLEVSNTGNIGANATLISETLGLNISIYIGPNKTIQITNKTRALNSPTNILLFSEDVLHASSAVSPPSLISFAIASEIDLENFLFAILSTLTLIILGVAIWKR
jgi:hypothetical protein